ncbi:MAG: radical SAM protein [Pilosibacter sp.]
MLTGQYPQASAAPDMNCAPPEPPYICGKNHDQRYDRKRDRLFSGCTLRVCSARISSSHENYGKTISASRLSDIFLELREKGCKHQSRDRDAVRSVDHPCPGSRKAKASDPGCFQLRGYEKTDDRDLADYVDIWLPDLKYMDSGLAKKYSAAPDYFEKASAAIKEMIRLTGGLSWNKRNPSMLDRGVIIRHMVLPGAKEDSIRLLHWIRENLPDHQYLISIMSQYTPFYRNTEYPEINRRITSYEYNKVVDTAIDLGLTEGFMQERSSAKEEYTPPFDCEGL